MTKNENDVLTQQGLKEHHERKLLAKRLDVWGGDRFHRDFSRIFEGRSDRSICGRGVVSDNRSDVAGVGSDLDIRPNFRQER